MVDKPELNWDQLNNLTAEVLSEDGPGTDGWNAEGSHTQAFNEHFIEVFRQNQGQMPGELGEVPLLLLTATGAKTGVKRTTPLSYHVFGDRTVVVASMGGAVRNPPWLHNVRANPNVTVEMGDEAFEARALITEGEDRDQLYEGICARMPVFKEYQERTERVIPVVEIKRLA